MLNITNHQENSNQNQNKASFHTPVRITITKKTIKFYTTVVNIFRLSSEHYLLIISQER